MCIYICRVESVHLPLSTNNCHHQPSPPPLPHLLTSTPDLKQPHYNCPISMYINSKSAQNRKRRERNITAAHYTGFTF
ncbi:hypothetical protein HanRHA438_Chr11g0512601 [Helianthus annuus]|nr:hypothetical protein HanRHA438_Chr11g0512601 [Helianthus annuus]